MTTTGDDAEATPPPQRQVIGDTTSTTSTLPTFLPAPSSATSTPMASQIAQPEFTEGDDRGDGDHPFRPKDRGPPGLDPTADHLLIAAGAIGKHSYANF